MKTILLFFIFLVSNVAYSQAYMKGYEAYQKGNYKKTIEEFERLIPLYKDTLGEYDPDILPDLRYYLGVSYYYEGRIDDACNILDKNYKVCEKAYDVFSEPGLNSLNDLVAIYNEKNDLAKVLEYRKEIVKGWRTISDVSYELAIALNDLGLSYYMNNEDKNAIPAYSEALEILALVDSVPEFDIPIITSNKAISHAYLGQYELAEKNYEKALVFFYKNNPSTYSKQFRTFRKIAQEMKEFELYENAINTLKIDNTIIKKHISKTDTALIENYTEIGFIQDQLGQNEASEKSFQEAITTVYANYPQGSKDRAFWEYYIASLLESNKSYAKAIELNLLSLQYYDGNKEYAGAEVMIINSLLRCYLAQEDNENALIYSKEKVDIYEKELQNKDYFQYYLSAVIEKSQIEQKLLDSRSAIATLEEAKRKTVKYMGKKQSYILLLNELITSHSAVGEFNQSIAYCTEKIELIEKVIGKGNDYYFAINERGLLYNQSGEYFKALDDYYFTHENLCKGSEELDYLSCANVLNNIALAHSELGNYKESEKLYLEIIDIHEKNNPDADEYVIALCNAGRLCLDMNKIEDSESFYFKANQLSLDRYGYESALHLSAKQGLANAYIRTPGKAEEGMNLFMECVELIPKIYGKGSSYGMQMFGNIAHVLCVAQVYEDAIKILELVYNEQKRQLGEHNLITMLTMTNLSLAYLSTDQPEKALPLSAKLTEYLNEDISNNLKLMSEGESIQYMDKMRLYYSAPFSYLHDQYASSKDMTILLLNTTLQNKGKLLHSNSALKKSIQKSGDEALISLYTDWTKTIQQIIMLQSQAGGEKQLDILVKEANELEKKLIKNSKSFAKSIDQDFDWKDVQKKLDDNEYVIEFVNFKKSKGFIGDSTQYSAFVFNKSADFPSYIPLFDEHELTEIIGVFGGNNLSYINSIYGKGRSSSKLYNLIWSKIESVIPEGSKVIISATGLLHKVSFAGLSNGSHFLNERYELSHVNSSSILLNQENENLSSINPLLIGGLNYDVGVSEEGNHIWSYLKGTELELSELNSLLSEKEIKVQSLSSESVSEKSLFENLKGKNIAHIATHGFFYPKPSLAAQEIASASEEIETIAFRGGNSGDGYSFYVNNNNAMMRSGLALSGANQVWNNEHLDIENDGVLTAQDIVLQDLEGLQLVVLSACETGLGDIKGSEGVFGLQRSLKIAGVDHLVMSLWQVPDNETKEFMVLFYTNLIQSKDIDQAFREAQNAMSKKYDPYFWAAFVLM